MYNSPIRIITSDLGMKMAKKFDDDIYQAVLDAGINVDKDELLRALQYDRGQYDKGYADGKADAAPKWIPVSERLPEVGERCLCNVKSFAFPGRFYQSILKYDKYGFVEGCIYTDDVTHWMPLPEPPKGE